MQGVTIIETEALNRLIDRIDKIEEVFVEMMKTFEADGKPWMNVKEAADYMRKSTSWLYQHKTKVGFSKLGGDILFNKKKVDAYLWGSFYQTGQ